MKTFYQKLQAVQQQNQSLLCVGLDPDIQRMPQGIDRDAHGVWRFCQAIVDATLDVVCAYKPQIAYFAALRAEAVLEKIITYIAEVAPHVPVILDAKRGDIGSTAEQYAQEAFVRYGADAVTLSPFMGWDTVEPYLQYEGKGVFLLCRTSNSGGDDLQARVMGDIPKNPKLFEHVAKLTNTTWKRGDAVGLVVGATYPQELARVRELAPHAALLIPGVGAQGGDAAATVHAAWRKDGPIVVNSSRAILYASAGTDFAQAARQAALRSQAELQKAQETVMQKDL